MAKDSGKHSFRNPKSIMRFPFRTNLSRPYRKNKQGAIRLSGRASNDVFRNATDHWMGANAVTAAGRLPVPPTRYSKIKAESSTLNRALIHYGTLVAYP